MKYILTIITLLMLTQLQAQYFNGVQRLYFDGPYNKLADFSTSKATTIDTVTSINISTKKSENFAFIFKSNIRIDTEGTYTFFTSSDDGSSLYIDSVLIVNNDGLHSIQERQGTRYLIVGYHSIEIQYFNKLGGLGLTISMSFAGVKKLIPDTILFLKKPPIIVDDSRLVFLENVNKDLNLKINNLLLVQASQASALNSNTAEFKILNDRIVKLELLLNSHTVSLGTLKTRLDTMPKPEKLFLLWPLGRIKDSLTILK